MKGVFESQKEMVTTDLQINFRGHPKLSNEQLALQYLMSEIQESLKTMSLSVLAEFSLPSTQTDLPPLMAPTQGQNFEELRRLAGEFTSKLHSEQHNVFNDVINPVARGVSTRNLYSTTGPQLPKTQRLLFLDAPGGTRKTVATTAIKRFLKS